MELSPSQEELLRTLCGEVIEAAKAQGAIGQSYKIPLVIPTPWNEFERTVTLEVSAHRDDYEDRWPFPERWEKQREREHQEPDTNQENLDRYA